MSKIEVQKYRNLQLDCMRNAVKLDDQSGNEHTIIVRVVPFVDALMAAILAQPDQSERLNAEAGTFFAKVDNELEAYRRRIALGFGVELFLKKREVVSTDMISNVYRVVALFYIRQKKLVQGWQWMQKSKVLDSFSSGDVLLRQVQEWVDEYLSFRKDDLKPLEYKKSALKRLRPLMTGIDEITDAGDILILTPSAPLSMLPLHGLSVDGQPLIERNIVIYCSSLTLLKNCILRSRQCETTEERSLSAAMFTAVYEEPGGEVEKDSILSSVANLAEDFGATKILGQELTVAKFREVLESAPWIHYHGHTYYERSSGLEQSFVLSDETAAEMAAKSPEKDRPPQSASDSITENGSLAQCTQDLLIPTELDRKRLMLASRSDDRLKISTRLTAADIFSMTLRGRPFVCCIACDSGAQDVYGGDEPFGLVSALFCAGASTVLGTLWPIASETGRMFTKYFYDNVREQLAEAEVRGRNTIDLASALSDSVRELRKWRSDPYSWAAFVLHGSPLYRFK
ncbi:hypothetical protein P7C71_g5627, partial [Lecanoromycetidae sp. Uapishka_2]